MQHSDDRIREALMTLPIPGTNTTLGQAGAVRHAELDGETARVLLVISTADPSATDALRKAVSDRLAAIPGVATAEVQVQAMLSTTLGQEEKTQRPAWAERIKGVRHVIAVASGKGGVGKSTVSTNLAVALARAGNRVGLLDADIYGPSQQMMTGATGEPAGDANGRIRPVQAAGGVSVMSLGFIIDADQPVIWRGPMLMKALEQLVSDVEWGELDYLVVDLPPGTGDVALTLCQNVPLAGAVIVTTPQDVALIDARKGLAMFRRLDVRVLGLVENMAGFECPQCGHVEQVFGAGGGERTARELQIPLLASIPLDPAIVTGGDSGRPVILLRPDSAAASAFTALAAAVQAATE